jgi:type IV secretory pathway VirB10-like protein
MTAAPTPPEPEGDPAESFLPSVAKPVRGLAGPLTIGAAVLAGVLVFNLMNGQRQGAARVQAKSTATAQAPISADAPPDLVALQEAARAPQPATSLFPPASAPLPVASAPLALVAAGTGPAAPVVDGERRRAPTLVVDFTGSGAANGQAAPATPGAASTAKAATNGLNADEQFAERVGGGQADVARASLIAHPQYVVPQGAMIPAVLETALNSDLPGFARAVVSQDVRAFDGSRVVIPRGSRVIGQYRSAVAQGQSRAFVIWTRIVRPDGATIQIGSPATDPLGRAGLEGKVNRHFFEQFGGSVLLSVVNAAVTNLANRSGSQIIIGSAQDAVSLGALAARPATVSPTIKVSQGAPVRIFVAKDLDFSSVPDLAP